MLYRLYLVCVDENIWLQINPAKSVTFWLPDNLLTSWQPCSLGYHDSMVPNISEFQVDSYKVNPGFTPICRENQFIHGFCWFFHLGPNVWNHWEHLRSAICSEKIGMRTAWGQDAKCTDCALESYNPVCMHLTMYIIQYIYCSIATRASCTSVLVWFST